MPLLLNNGCLRRQVLMLALIVGAGLFPERTLGDGNTVKQETEGSGGSEERAYERVPQGFRCYVCNDNKGCHKGDTWTMKTADDMHVCTIESGNGATLRSGLGAKTVAAHDCIQKTVKEECVSSSEAKRIVRELRYCIESAGSGRESRKQVEATSACFCFSDLCNGGKGNGGNGNGGNGNGGNGNGDTDNGDTDNGNIGNNAEKVQNKRFSILLISVTIFALMI